GLCFLALATGLAAWLLRDGERPVTVAESAESPRVLAPSKPFTLKDAGGRPHSLADYKGQVVLLHFWATWCPPCVEEIPALMDFARGLEGKPFRLLLVGLDETWEQAHTVLPKEGLPANVVALLDPESEVPEAYGS